MEDFFKHKSYFFFLILCLFLSNLKAFALTIDTTGYYLKIIDNTTKVITQINNDEVVIKTNQSIYKGTIFNIFNDSLFLNINKKTEKVAIKDIIFIRKYAKNSQIYEKNFTIKLIKLSCVYRKNDDEDIIKVFQIQKN